MWSPFGTLGHSKHGDSDGLAPQNVCLASFSLSLCWDDPMEPLSSEECVHLTQFFCFQGYYCCIGWGHMCHGMDTEVRGQDYGALPLPPPYIQIPGVELRLPGLSGKCLYSLSHLSDLLFF